VSERALRIAVDGRELMGRPTGVGRYLLEILRAWAEDPGMRHDVTVILPASPPPHLAALGPRIAWRVEPTTKPGTWWEQMRLPRVLARLDPDVLFAPGYTAPLQHVCPTVVTIHDVSFWAHPEGFRRRERLRRRWLTRTTARRAARILTVSEFSAREIAKWLRVSPDRIDVVPNGAPQTVARAGAAPGPTVLYVGSLLNRRRIPLLLQAFRLVHDRLPDARLVLAGENRTSPPIDPLRIADSLGIGDRVEYRAYVADDDLPRLYDDARVFAFLSDYEGFGLTPFEAIAHGVPPVLLDTPVAREIYGDAARLVPADAPAIAQALVTLLTDETAREALARAGAQRLPAFTWTRTASAAVRALEAAARPAAATAPAGVR
jgi:glycosyltransferase involved in cell wall biosynthesis